jgi:Trypsin-like peptidase domain
MYHQPPANFLYSAYLLRTKFLHPDGTVKEGSGTGFVLSIKDGFPVIVTNRHVVDIDYRQPSAKYKDFSIQELFVSGRRADDTTYTFRLYPTAKVFYSEVDENDVVLIEPRMYEDPPDQFAQGLHWHFGMEHLATQEIFDNLLQPYDDVAFTGFPDQYDKLANRPILRSGKIASDPKFDYSWSDKFEGSCVAYEAFSSEGASGSPVFAPPRGLHTIPGSRHGYLVGINAGHIPDHNRYGGHSGISYFYKSTVILDIIHQAKLI